MINIIFGNPEGFDTKTYTLDEAFLVLTSLNNKEKDLYVDHQAFEIIKLTKNIIEDASHIIVQDKMVGA